MIVLTLAVSFAADPAAAMLAVKGFDPVELVAGKEVKGVAEHALVHLPYKYLFTSAANKEKFASDPAAYSIQFGGACMNMGPTSANCNSERFAVHAGRIYAFASDGCRASFLKAPENFIDHDDLKPTGSTEQAARAKALLDKAVDALGDAMTLAKLRGVNIDFNLTYQTKGDPYQYGSRTAIRFPFGLAKIVTYDGRKSGWTVNDTEGRNSLDADAPPVDDSVKRFMVRQFYREPVALLMAWRDGRVKTAYALKRTTVDGKAAEQVVVYIAGAATTLAIDPETGRVLEASFKDRGLTAGIQQQSRRYSDFRRVDGVELPHAIAYAAADKPIANPKVKVVKVSLE
jgi:YHS domain-containing protein